MNTSFTIYISRTKFLVLAEYIHMQGSLSQNFDLSLRYFFYEIKHKNMSKNILKKFQSIIKKSTKA